MSQFIFCLKMTHRLLIGMDKLLSDTKLLENSSSLLCIVVVLVLFQRKITSLGLKKLIVRFRQETKQNIIISLPTYPGLKCWVGKGQTNNFLI